VLDVEPELEPAMSRISSMNCRRARNNTLLCTMRIQRNLQRAALQPVRVARELEQESRLDAGRCGLIEGGVDYVVQSDLASLVNGVTSAESCCSACGREPRGHAWTWVKERAGAPARCWLKWLTRL